MPSKKPPISKLSPKDRSSTIAHLTETIDNNARHDLAHTKEVLSQAKKLPKDNPLRDTLIHNASHALNHSAIIKEHTQKLTDHLNKYPSTKAMIDELNDPVKNMPGPVKPIGPQSKAPASKPIGSMQDPAAKTTSKARNVKSAKRKP